MARLRLRYRGSGCLRASRKGQAGQHADDRDTPDTGIEFGEFPSGGASLPSTTA
jgi:hypothetical protein